MGVPLVLFDRTAKELDVSKVVADDADAASKSYNISSMAEPEESPC